MCTFKFRMGLKRRRGILEKENEISKILPQISSTNQICMETSTEKKKRATKPCYIPVHARSSPAPLMCRWVGSAGISWKDRKQGANTLQYKSQYRGLLSSFLMLVLILSPLAPCSYSFLKCCSNSEWVQVTIWKLVDLLQMEVSLIFCCCPFFMMTSDPS